jgi:hypothetical protein
LESSDNKAMPSPKLLDNSIIALTGISSVMEEVW